jgi:hypothetical protein
MSIGVALGAVFGDSGAIAALLWSSRVPCSGSDASATGERSIEDPGSGGKPVALGSSGGTTTLRRWGWATDGASTGTGKLGFADRAAVRVVGAVLAAARGFGD